MGSSVMEKLVAFINDRKYLFLDINNFKQQLTALN